MYSLILGISHLICRMPVRLRNWLGAGLGALAWLVVPAKRRHLAYENMRLALKLPPETVKKLVKESVTRFGRMLIAVLYLPKITKETLDDHVRMVGAEHLTAALAEGHGAVIATAHSGNWEILGAALAMHGFPLVAVVQKQTNSAMDRFINEYRTLAGMHVTYKSGVREMVHLLGQGMIIGLLSDQDAGSNGVFVDFFGRTASTPQGAAALARLKAAPILPVFITEEADGRHTILVHPPIRVIKTADRDADIHLATEKITKAVEEHIRRYPAEWFWLHNRWKTLPPQEKSE